MVSEVRSLYRDDEEPRQNPERDGHVVIFYAGPASGILWGSWATTTPQEASDGAMSRRHMMTTVHRPPEQGRPLQQLALVVHCWP
jgi:hypothetical protein